MQKMTEITGTTEMSKEMVAERIRLQSELFKSLIGRYNLTVNKNFEVTLSGQSKSGYPIKAIIQILNFSKNYTFSLKLPSEWYPRLKHSYYWSDSKSTDFVTLWESLLEEDESVLKPLDQPIHDVSSRKEAISEVLEDYQFLLKHCREDWDSETAQLATQQLKAHLEEDSCLDSIWDTEIKGCYYLGGLTYRGYVIQYKGYGFILADIGNSNWSYDCTVEEFLLDQHSNPEFHVKKKNE